MTISRLFCIFVGASVAIASCSVSTEAQSSPAGNQPNMNSVRLKFQKRQLAAGEKAIAVLTTKNLSQNQECFSTNPSFHRIYVVRDGSESPKTEFYRHLLGDFRPGDGPELMPGPVDCRSISPGLQDSQKYDLSRACFINTSGE
jgi:hypothetical protein